MALLRTSMQRISTDTVCAPPPRTALWLHWCGPVGPCWGLCRSPAGPRDMRHSTLARLKIVTWSPDGCKDTHTACVAHTGICVSQTALKRREGGETGAGSFV